MSKYKIRRIANNKTVIAQSGINEMTDIVSTKDVHSANPFVDKAIEIYKLDEDRATALKAKILKRGEFIVEPLSPSELL
jgi:hypothetical protein